MIMKKFSKATEEDLQKEYDIGREAGIEQERTRVVKMILDTAAELFCLGKDEQAKQMRSLANTISPIKK
jgi:hypothetical protein